jgi:ATP-dependent protease ClpP protease subunit
MDGEGAKEYGLVDHVLQPGGGQAEKGKKEKASA